MEKVEESVAIAFHGIEYIVSVSVEGSNSKKNKDGEEQLAFVQVEDEKSEKQWAAKFPASYIEEITRRTGNFKRFHVFMNMLMMALSQRSDSVFIDLLTYSDLELYRKRKVGRNVENDNESSHSFPRSGSPSTANKSNTKRYLILTYTVEFDRVHYPLPLSLIENPSTAVLQKTIRRLRQKLAELKSTGFPESNSSRNEQNYLREENNELKTIIQNYKCESNGSASTRELAMLEKDLEACKSRNHELSEAFQRVRTESANEIDILRRELQMQKGGSSVSKIESLKQKVHLLEETIHQERLQHKKEIIRMRKDLKEYEILEEDNKSLALKNKELMRQLAVSRNKLNSQLATSSLTSNRPPSAALNRKKNSNSGSSRSNLRKKYTRSGSASDSERPSTSRSPYKGRFDPTAYHEEKQRKLRARSQSPGLPKSKRYPKQRQSITRTNGYRSDSSGGYISNADSETSTGSSARRVKRHGDFDEVTQRSRSRTRSSAARQRASMARLSSPKTTASLRGCSPTPSLSSNKSRISSRSPSPAGRNIKSSGLSQKNLKKPPTNLYQAPSHIQKSNLYNEENEIPVNSFDDIDNRLSALQSFLNEAKNNVESSL